MTTTAMNKSFKLDKDIESHKVYIRDGCIGKDNTRFDNVVKVNFSKHFNGSGENHFGGAENWPTLEIEIGFMTGEEEKMKMLAVRLSHVIDEYMSSLGEGR